MRSKLTCVWCISVRQDVHWLHWEEIKGHWICYLCSLSFFFSFSPNYPAWIKGTYVTIMVAHKRPNNHLSMMSMLCLCFFPFPIIFFHSLSSAFILPRSLCINFVCVCHSMCLRVGVWFAWLDYCPTVSHWQFPLCTPSAHRIVPSFPSLSRGRFTQILQSKTYFLN